MDLTVAIPTFDRNEVLAQNLQQLLPQLEPGCRVLVIDNHSPRAVEETIASLTKDYPGWVTLVRNNVNIGLSANIIRALELCETEWVWLLGDDDRPLPGAIATVRRMISQHSECRYFNFASELFERPATIVTRGIDEFVDRLDSFPSAVFISSCVFHVPTVRAYLTWAHSYSYCAIPHFVSLLMSLGETEQCVLSTERLVSWNRPDLAKSWSMIDAALRIPTVLELPLSKTVRRSLSHHLAGSLVPPEGIVRQLLAIARHEGHATTARFYYSQIRARRAALVGPFGRLRLACYAPLLWFPRLGALLVETLAPVLLGARSNENRLQDRSRAM